MSIEELSRLISGDNRKAVSDYVKRNPTLIDQVDPSSGYTPLHIASLHGYIEDVQLLLQSGANIYSYSMSGLSVLETAQANGDSVTRLKVISILLANGAGLYGAFDSKNLAEVDFKDFILIGARVGKNPLPAYADFSDIHLRNYEAAITALEDLRLDRSQLLQLVRLKKRSLEELSLKQKLSANQKTDLDALGALSEKLSNELERTVSSSSRASGVSKFFKHFFSSKKLDDPADGHLPPSLTDKKSP